MKTAAEVYQEQQAQKNITPRVSKNDLSEG